MTTLGRCLISPCVMLHSTTACLEYKSQSAALCIHYRLGAKAASSLRGMCCGAIIWLLLVHWGGSILKLLNIQHSNAVFALQRLSLCWRRDALYCFTALDTYLDYVFHFVLWLIYETDLYFYVFNVLPTIPYRLCYLHVLTFFTH